MGEKIYQKKEKDIYNLKYLPLMAHGSLNLELAHKSKFCLHTVCIAFPTNLNKRYFYRNYEGQNFGQNTSSAE